MFFSFQTNLILIFLLNGRLASCSVSSLSRLNRGKMNLPILSNSQDFVDCSATHLINGPQLKYEPKRELTKALDQYDVKYIYPLQESTYYETEFADDAFEPSHSFSYNRNKNFRKLSKSKSSLNTKLHKWRYDSHQYKAPVRSLGNLVLVCLPFLAIANLIFSMYLYEFTLF